MENLTAAKMAFNFQGLVSEINFVGPLQR